MPRPSTRLRPRSRVRCSSCQQAADAEAVEVQHGLLIEQGFRERRRQRQQEEAQQEPEQLQALADAAAAELDELEELHHLQHAVYE